jgi:hypothetical protein
MLLNDMLGTRRHQRPSSIVAKLLNGKVSIGVRLMQALHAWSPYLSRLLFASLQPVALRIKSYKIGTYRLLLNVFRETKNRRSCTLHHFCV